METARLVLREIVPSDAAGLFAFRSDAEAERHNDAHLTSMAEAHALVERLDTMRRDDGAVHWGLTVKGSDTVVGLLGYNEVVAEHRRAAVGYGMSRRLWGRGIMTEALTAVLDHGFGALALNRVEAHTNAEHHTSIRMLRGLGFVREGTFHDRFLDDGKFIDVALFVMLRRHRP